MANLTLRILQYVFPRDTVWSFNGAEIVGYSISKNLHFVIEDGMCFSEDGTYVLSIYRPADQEHFINWLPTKEREYSIKYPNDDKLIEERINFKNDKVMVNYRTKIESL